MSKTQTVGILHPGQMGVSIAASIQNGGHTVYWASAGRSPETHERATKLGFQDAGTLENLVKTCPTIVSVCPPAAAEKLAEDVLSLGFTGVYIDANAIAPQRAIRIGEAMNKAEATFVDGSIIGGPAWKPNSTWLHLSGGGAAQAAAIFSAGPVETNVVAGGVGRASALKMCFAAYTKGSTALISAVVAAAESLGVRTELEEQWSQNGSDFAEQTSDRVRGVTAKAWRFVGEMHEISETFSGAGVPGEFHAAAADVYTRMAEFKGAEELPSLEAVLQSMLRDHS
ncbi:MAG: DUF1932 domain-containing protein [Chloroflexota bacterium]